MTDSAAAVIAAESARLPLVEQDRDEQLQKLRACRSDYSWAVDQQREV
jgi:hypothetical protein